MDTTTDLTIRRTLGNWLPTSLGMRLQWETFYIRHPPTLLIKEGTTLNCHEPLRNNTPRAFKTEPSTTITTLPSNAVPIDINTTEKKITIPFAVPKVNKQEQTEVTPTTWEEYISTLPQFEQELLSHIKIHNLEKLIDTLHNDVIVFLASDGGAICNGVSRPSGVPTVAVSAAGITCTSSGKIKWDTSRSNSACFTAGSPIR